ncbi:heterokaryon incompatibility protein-domain-containing protein [Xylaria scruposa]|nr:heterokaryon incompatibility protein-domain-containing protein [Xylaria scruposa]
MSASTPSEKELTGKIRRSHRMLYGSSKAVERIVSELCQQDSRFQFIQECIRDFVIVDKKAPRFSGLYNFMRHHQYFSRLVPSFEPLQSLEDILKYHGELCITLCEIICAAIYEILDTFNLDFTIDQVPTRIDVGHHVKLLYHLYKQSKHLSAVQSQPTAPLDTSNKGQETSTFRYTESLVSFSRKKIRVLRIDPGVGESRLDCHLEVRDLYADDIDEALSYVWGECRASNSIWIDGCTFFVTKNLYEILLFLRYPDRPRTIWVDAVCINQSDLNEKALQVRHMDEVYHKANKTTIWLSGQTLLDSPHPFDPKSILAPLPTNFGGHTMHQYDLVSVLAKMREAPYTRSKEGITLAIILYHCVNAIMSCDWWERVWTIQEAVLPQEHPQFMFQGHEFSFDDLISAINWISKFGHIRDILCYQDGPVREDDTQSLKDALLLQVLYWRRNNEANIVPHLRPGLEDRRKLSNSIFRGIQLLLCETSYYKATNPRDKCFALQTLLPKTRRRLIYVDYTKSTEVIFQRVTAQCYNTTEHMGMTTTFKLLVETQPTAERNASSPSWVQDFTYSDASRYCQSSGDRVTFSGYLYLEKNWQPEYKNHGNNLLMNICFATPRTLFCSGRGIDIIHTAGTIPDFSNEFSAERLSIFLGSIMTSVAVQRNWVDLGEHHKDGASRDEMRVPSIETVCNFDSGDAEKPAFTNRSQANLQLIKEQLSAIIDLLYLGDISSCATIIFSSGMNVNARQRRLKEVSGMQYFVTRKGLVGIATAPVTEGDMLAVIHAAPAYFIFREAESNDGHVAQRHRMVARAVLSETKEKMREMFADLDNRNFEIV